MRVQRPLPFTYSGVGATRSDSAPAGYVHDRHRRQLGTGERAFAAARDPIRAWKMFPSPLATIEPVGIPIAEGEVAVVVAHILGVWTLHAAGIVHVIDEPRRFGFAYGTLPGHATRGGERFLVEWLPDDAVWYDLQAFSRQRSWLTRLAYPITAVSSSGSPGCRRPRWLLLCAPRASDSGGAGWSSPCVPSRPMILGIEWSNTHDTSPDGGMCWNFRRCQAPWHCPHRRFGANAHAATWVAKSCFQGAASRQRTPPSLGG